MRFAITLKRGGGEQRYDCNYGNVSAAVFGVLRKDAARSMTQYTSRGQRAAGQHDLDITVQPNCAFEPERPLSKGARPVPNRPDE